MTTNPVSKLDSWKEAFEVVVKPIIYAIGIIAAGAITVGIVNGFFGWM